ncbi:high-affinity choline transporter 1-like [Haemaphysalis longicornis]
MLSYIAAVGCLILAIPPITIGAASKTTNFTATKYGGPFNLAEDDRAHVLSLAIEHLTPNMVSTIGMLAITAAVMSSMDSSMLSASSLVTRNIYHFIVRPTASDMEVCFILRVMVVLLGMAATVMALQVQSVFALWTLSSDLAYVLLFPQFVALFYYGHGSNAYGSFAGFTVGCLLRCLCGEPLVNVPATIQLPLYDEERGQQFPFRTACMIVTFLTMQTFSFLTKWAFEHGIIPEELDVWNCFAEDAPMVDQARARSSAAASFPVTPAAPPTPISFEVSPSTPPEGDQQKPQQTPAPTTTLPPTSTTFTNTTPCDESSKLARYGAGSTSAATHAGSIPTPTAPRKSSTRKSLSIPITDNPTLTMPYGQSSKLARDSVASSSAGTPAGGIPTPPALKKSTPISRGIPNTGNPTPMTTYVQTSKSARGSAGSSSAATPPGGIPMTGASQKSPAK